MAFHVRDPETDRVVRKLAELKGKSLTETVKDACAAELKRASYEVRMAKLRELQDRIASYGRTGLVADKAFYDSLNDE